MNVDNKCLKTFGTQFSLLFQYTIYWLVTKCASKKLHRPLTLSCDFKLASPNTRMKFVRVILENSVDFTSEENDCITFLFIALHFLHDTAFVMFRNWKNVIIPIIPVWMLTYTKLQLAVVHTIGSENVCVRHSKK